MAAAGDSGGDSGPRLVAFCRRPLNHTHSTHFTLPPRHTQQVYMIMMLCVASRSFPGAVDDKLCEHVTSDRTVSGGNVESRRRANTVNITDMVQ